MTTDRQHCTWCASRSGARCSVDGRNLVGGRRSLACVTRGWFVGGHDLLDRLGALTRCTPEWYARVTGLPVSVVRVRLFGERNRGAEVLAMMAWIAGAASAISTR